VSGPDAAGAGTTRVDAPFAGPPGAPPVWSHLKPVAPVEAEPSRVTVSPTRTVWAGPAFAQQQGDVYASGSGQVRGADCAGAKKAAHTAKSKANTAAHKAKVAADKADAAAKASVDANKQ